MVKLKSGIKIRSGIKILVSDNDMILVYAFPYPSTNIELAIQANSAWFSAGQSVVINWGDGSAAETVSAASDHTGYIGHTYASARTYTIKISGSMTMYGRSGAVSIAGQTYLTRIDSFGKLGITSLAYAFYNCTRLKAVPKTVPDSVTDMNNMLRSCTGDLFNPDVSNWDVSKVENMNSIFRSCLGAAFNPDVSKWDVSKVTNMSYMFSGCLGVAFRGGRGSNGSGIANWTPKSLLTGAATGLSDFMLNAKAQDATYLDSILNAWAALIGDIVNPLPTGITCHFGTTEYTSAGAASHAQLTASTSSGGAAWTIASGGLQA